MIRPKQIADAYAHEFLKIEEDEDGKWLYFGGYRFLLSDTTGDPQEAVKDLRDDLAEHIEDAIDEAFFSANNIIQHVVGGVATGGTSYLPFGGSKIPGNN